MTMDARLRAYAPNGATLGFLPAPTSWDVGDPLNDVPALKLEYALDAPRSGLLGQPIEIAVELSGDGDSWVEPRGSRYLYLKDGRDPLKPGDNWQAEAPGYLWLLKKAKVRPDSGGNPARPFDFVSPGYLAGVLFDEAKSRGALAGMTKSWTATHDSAGRAWPETLSRELTAGVDMLAVLIDLADAGYLDFQTTGRELQLFVPEFGTDRTVGNNQVTITALSSPAAPFRRTWEGIAGVIMGQGENNLYQEHTEAGAIQPWGRWEEYVTHSGVSDSGTLLALMAHQAELTRGPRTEFTQEIEPNAGPRPYLDFIVGDYVWSRSLSGALTRVRVRQITLTSSGGRLGANVVLNDRFLEADIRAQRRIQALSGGASASGSTGSTPMGNDILPPAAPIQPTASSEFYVDGAGIPHAQVSLDWPNVTTNMDGSPLNDLDHYQVWVKESGHASWRWLASVTESVAFLSPFPPGTLWDFKVKAVDSVDNHSQWSPVTSILTATDAEAPETPSTPVATSQGGFLVVDWDGRNEAGNPQNEPDLFRVEVHVSSSISAVPTPGSSNTMVSSFTGPGRVLIPGFAVGSTYYVRLVAVDSSLNASDPTPPDAVVITSDESDGDAPDTSGWSVTLEPLGLMALQATWTALANPDAVEYRVYASPTAPVPRNATTLVGITGGTGLSFGAIDGQLLVPRADYYVSVVAFDADGDGLPVTAGPMQIKQADADSVSDEWSYLGPISADQIATGSLSATLAIIGELTTAGTGRRVSFSSADGIVAEDPNGDLVAQIPTDLSRDINLQADLVAKSVTALGPVAMRAPDNEVAQNATLRLQSATASPVSPPSVTVEYETVGQNNPYASWNGGGNYYAGKYYHVWNLLGYSGVYELSSTGIRTAWSLPIGDPNSGNGAGCWGCYRDGDFVYVLVHTNSNVAAGWAGQWQVRKYRYDTKAFVSLWVAGTDPDVYTSYYKYTPTICRSNAPAGALTMVLADANTGYVRRHTHNADTGAIINGDVSNVIHWGRIHWAYEGTADVGANRLWFGSNELDSRAFALVAATGGTIPIYDAQRSFRLNGAAAALFWDENLSRFVQLNLGDGLLTRYEGGDHQWLGADTQSWYVTNTWRDNDAGGTGTHETAQGPPAIVDMRKRARMKVTTPPIPTDANNLNLDDPNAVSIYVGRVDGSRATQYRQAAPATGVRTAILNAVLFSNADTFHPNPPVSGNFPLATPARVESSQSDEGGPLLWFDGSGDGRWAKMDSGWKPYTPTVATSSAGSNGGIRNGLYVQHGKTVHFRATIQLTSGFSIGSSFGISLPVPRAMPTYLEQMGAQAQFLDAGNNNFWAQAYLGNNIVAVLGMGTAGGAVALSATYPFPWAVNDIVEVAGTYRAA